MERRRFIEVIAGGLLAAPLAVEAQEQITRPRIAFLGAESPSTSQHFLDAFRQGLREHGYVDGQNIALEHEHEVPHTIATTDAVRPHEVGVAAFRD